MTEEAGFVQKWLACSKMCLLVFTKFEIQAKQTENPGQSSAFKTRTVYLTSGTILRVTRVSLCVR